MSKDVIRDLKYLSVSACSSTDLIRALFSHDAETIYLNMPRLKANIDTAIECLNEMKTILDEISIND